MNKVHCGRNTYKANVSIASLAIYLAYLQYSIDITTEQSFRYMELADAKV